MSMCNRFNSTWTQKRLPITDRPAICTHYYMKYVMYINMLQCVDYFREVCICAKFMSMVIRLVSKGYSKRKCFLCELLLLQDVQGAMHAIFKCFKERTLYTYICMHTYMYIDIHCRIKCVLCIGVFINRTYIQLYT